jgi:hypothetical protein
MRFFNRNMKAGYLFLLGWMVAVANAATLPFSETFDGLSDGLLSAQMQWTVLSGTSTVQTNVGQSGKAVKLDNSSIAHSLSSTNSAVWLSFWVRYTDLPSQNPVVSNANTSVAFYINTNGSLVVYSNTTPVTLSTIIPANVWTRFDVYCDYDALTWNLSVNKTNVCAGLPLFSTNRQIDSILFKNEGASAVYVDEIAVADIEPSAVIIDADGDGIPDWWEQKYYGAITAASPNAPAANGVNTLLDAYIAGLGPFGTDRFVLSGEAGPGGTLRWTGQPGRRYSVYWTTNLLSGFTLLQADIPADSAEFTDSVHTNQTSGYYQVRVGF